MGRPKVKTHEDLEVYQVAVDSAMKIFELSKRFPIQERYSLTDQMRRTIVSFCLCKAEAWRKRRYRAAFIAKLSDAEAEAGETQVWLKFAVKCNYLEIPIARELYRNYNQILGSLVKIINNPDKWLL